MSYPVRLYPGIPGVKGRCSCTVIEYEDGSGRRIPRPGCDKHASDFPPPPPTERERYERAFREAGKEPPQNVKPNQPDPDAWRDARDDAWMRETYSL